MGTKCVHKFIKCGQNEVYTRAKRGLKRHKRGLNVVKTRPKCINILFKRGERALKTQKHYLGRNNANDGAYQI